ncbi:MAG: hypothetical protein ACYCX3_02530 [Thermoleophilia bacterium]
MSGIAADGGRTVDYAAWREERRLSLAAQVELLGERRGPRTHRPRSGDEWDAITDGVRAELRRREASGRWTWVDPRRMVVRAVR